MKPLMITVVIVDTTPLRYLNEPVTRRTVNLRLTPEQHQALALRDNEEYSVAMVEDQR